MCEIFKIFMFSTVNTVKLHTSSPGAIINEMHEKKSPKQILSVNKSFLLFGEMRHIEKIHFDYCD